jgi:hypothetical protein
MLAWLRNIRIGVRLVGALTILLALFAVVAAVGLSAMAEQRTATRTVAD